MTGMAGGLDIAWIVGLVDDDGRRARGEDILFSVIFYTSYFLIALAEGANDPRIGRIKHV